MRVRDMGLAVLTSVIWGFAFVTYKFGLESFSAPQLTALRFMIACLPVLFVPRPKLPWSAIVLIGLTLFAGQFLLLFFAFALDMPAGLASVTQQTQAFFTVLLAAVFLREIPRLRQGVGMAIAFAGLVLIGLTTGADLKPAALGLALAAALSWAIGNILVKRTAGVPVFPLMAWCSLVAPWPVLLLSWLVDPQPSLIGAVMNASWPSIATALYLGTLATPIAYGMWSHLLQRYPASVVAPFALLSPATGILSSALILGEVFGPLRYAGMALILAGLAVIVWPTRKISSRGPD
ncbi:MAG: O-acetylserine/cysteine efflux transporter [Alphaproteobacteria bacterium]|jgi:O-acetylserine/cysteine efflux transporter|nr:O-acetylserine/cysteine efflux transporter [Alphaproteobacteria bacterium]